MRHAEVCTCRDCGSARLGALMEGAEDEGARLAFAVAAIQVGCESFVPERVALPYPEVLATAERIEKLLVDLEELVETVPDPYFGPMGDLIAHIEVECSRLRRAWRREP